MTVPARNDERAALAPGVRLGPYEILAPLGAGGMGEVYRARDERLGREVAVKVLPADSSSDPDRLRRFEQEARAAGALNHPNLLAVFDTGQHDGSPYVVFELLDGVTLRQRLGPGPLPVRKAVDYAVQIAQGLAAAHEKGIVHRDLKPENLFVTRDGRVKILDFGLAKLRPTLDPDAPRAEGGTVSTATGAGVVLGTVGYMSPEQVKGDPADHRSDIFALGSVLYEMLSGRRAFVGETTAEVMTAILKEDPAEPAGAKSSVPSALERVVRRCLEKRPEERFQSARDIGFALEALSSGSGSQPSTVIPARPKLRLLAGLIAAALLVGALTASFLVGKQTGEKPAPSFQRLSFRRGMAWSARFAPDGQTIVYGAAWEGKPIRLYSTRADSPESRLLDLPDADVLAISSSGEMAILLNRSALLYPQQSLGTLARASLAGGAPRQILEEVQGADWSPDGKELAVIREVGDRKRLEYPIGKVLYEGGHGLRTPRVSPRGDLVAFREDGIHVVDRAGKKRTLSAGWGFGEGLAWSPKGDEVWFSASKTGIAQISLCAVTLSGRLRVVARFPLLFHLEDVSRDGHILASLAQVRNVLSGLAPGETQERELSWLDFPLPADLSADGKMLLFSEVGQGAGPQGAVYLRKTDGSSPAVKLGEGMAISLSGDSKWALALPFHAFAPSSELTVLPTGPGEPKVVKLEGIEAGPNAKLLPDGKRILVQAREPGGRWRAYVVDVAGGRPRPVTPEGVEPESVSTDGRFLAASNRDGKVIIYPIDGGDPRPLPGPPARDWIGPWSGDGRFLFVAEWKGVDITIFRRDLATGRRERWKEITQGDPAGILAMELRLGSDGRSYALKFHRQLSDLFLIEGLR